MNQNLIAAFLFAYNYDTFFIEKFSSDLFTQIDQVAIEYCARLKLVNFIK
jgi:hypothetical protein